MSCGVFWVSGRARLRFGLMGWVWVGLPLVLIDATLGGPQASTESIMWRAYGGYIIGVSTAYAYHADGRRQDE
jgi:hypothetical protein